ARTGGEPRSGGVLRGWWLGIHHFVVAPLAVCHPLKEIECQGFDCVKHGFLCPRVVSLYQTHRRPMAGFIREANTAEHSVVRPDAAFPRTAEAAFATRGANSPRALEESKIADATQLLGNLSHHH